jgi:hypothetical protein
MKAYEASQSLQVFQGLRRLVEQCARQAATVTLVMVAGFGISTGRAQPSNYYGGLLNTALGNATLQVGSGGALIVSGIGSSGNDGVRIATGVGGGTTLNLGTFNPDVLGVGASLALVWIGRSDGNLQQLSLQSMATNGAIFADFTGLGAPVISVALYSNDTLVAFADGIPPTTALATFTTAGTPHGGGLPMIISPCTLNPEACYGNVDFTLSIPDSTGPNGSIITIPGQGPMFCTRMQITPAFPTPYFVPTYQVKATTITGVNLGSISIQHEGYIYIEHEGHTGAAIENNALGHARFDFSTSSADVLVENLDESGTDGVDVALRNANSFRGDMVALNPQPLPPSNSPSLLTISATGTLAGGATEQTLGMLRLLNQETNLGLTADLSPVSSPGVQVELWQGCTLVSSYSVANGGMMLTSTQGATGVSVGYDPGDDPCGTAPPLPPWWWWVKWPGPVQLTTPTGPVMADRVRVAPETGTPSLMTLNHVSFQMVGPQTLDFTSQTALRLGVDFGGDQHFALGQATLGVNAAGQLNVGNIGPTGTDGVEIPLSRAHWAAAAGSLINRPLLSNSAVTYEFHAMLDHVRDRIASSVTATGNTVGETQITANMSPFGATRHRYLFIGHGTKLTILDLDVTNQPTATFSVSSNVVAVIPSLCTDFTHSNCYLRIKLPTPPGDPGPVIRFSPTLAVIADEVIIMPEDPVRLPGPQNRVLITGSCADLFQFNSEELGLFGNGHTGLGTATLVADAEMLTVGHLGTSGNNGVSINFNGALNALVSFTVPASNHVVRDMAGTFIHELGRNLGLIHGRADALAASGQITTDFSPIGSSTQTIEVRSNSQLIQRITGHDGNIGSVSAWPAGLGEQSAGSPTGAPGFIVPFGQVVQISINGGPTLQGDELRVFPENPSQTIGNLQSLNLLASGFDSITVTNETVTPALTPTISGITLSDGTNVVLSVPTVFGYDYTLDAVDTLGPLPLPWAPVASFFGDGTVQQIKLPADKAVRFFHTAYRDSTHLVP